MAKLDDTDIHRIVQNEIDDAVLYQEEKHTGFRDTATNFYYGEPFGNEVENQSQVVSRDVADTVGFIMPSLMKIFASSQDFVSFQPRHPEDEAAAKQASEYGNWIVTGCWIVCVASISNAMRTIPPSLVTTPPLPKRNHWRGASSWARLT